MTRSDIMATLAGASDEDLKDKLLEAAVKLWKSEGYSNEDIAELVLEISTSYVRMTEAAIKAKAIEVKGESNDQK